MSQSHLLKDTKHWWDKASIYTSAACAVHCLLTPVLIAIAPPFFVLGIEEHVIHKVLVVLIIPMSLIAMYKGCQKHNESIVMIGITLGLTILLITALIGHDVLGETGEKVGTVLGSFILILNHALNYRLCRKLDCHLR